MKEIVLMLELYGERYLQCDKAQMLFDDTFRIDDKQSQFEAILSFAKMKLREEREKENEFIAACI